MDEGKLEETLRKMRDLKKLYAEDYEAGFLPKWDLEGRLTSDLYSMFDECLGELGLRRSKPLTNENLARYAEDYALWASGAKPDSSVGEPWLLRHAGGLDYHYFAKGIEAWEPWLLPQAESRDSCVEASANERAAYFQLAREPWLRYSPGRYPPTIWRSRRGTGPA